MRQTVKLGKARLARLHARKAYSFPYTTHPYDTSLGKVVRRAGVTKVGS
jgi:hypothetical protein